MNMKSEQWAWPAVDRRNKVYHLSSEGKKI